MAISNEVWRYHVLPFCNLDVLFRLNAVCRALRGQLNHPDVVCEWLHTAWYVKPQACPCDRRQFLVDMDRWLAFTWDYRGGDEMIVPGLNHSPTNLREMQLVLRQYGRTVPMMYQSQTNEFASMPTIRYPYERQSDFTEGMYSCDLPCILVPLPRMLNTAVEATTTVDGDRSYGNPVTNPNWGHHHEVTNDMMDRLPFKGELPGKWNADQDGPVPPTGFRELPYENPLEYYRRRCIEEQLNPLDPNQDTDNMDGYRAVQWARHMLYGTAVGLEQFPGYLCMNQEDLCGLAYRMGPVYIERRFISSRRYDGNSGEAEFWGMHGMLCFNGIRYENERGDFATWCLHTMATLQTLYLHGWNDTIRCWLRGYRAFVMGLCTEIEEDFPLGSLVDTWRTLEKSCFVYQPLRTRTVRGQSPPLEERDLRRARRYEAMVFLMNQNYRHEYLHLQCVVRNYLQTPYHLRAERNFRAPYLHALVPSEHWNTAEYPEVSLVSDVENLLQISEFVLGFSEKVAPRVDPRTRSTRRRMHLLHLNAASSLLLWAPHWTRPFFHCGLRYMNVRIAANHRYRELLNYLNARSLFHHPRPEDWWIEQTQGMDIGRILAQ